MVSHPSQQAHERIWATVAAIPPGRVMSYGEVARRSGLPRRARFVSQALRKAPDSMKLPWHRVINAQGRISFPPGSSGYRLQRGRLESEGVCFQGETVVSRHRCAEQTESLDEILWGPPVGGD